MGACKAAGGGGGGGDCLIKLFGKTIIPVPDAGAGDVDKVGVLYVLFLSVLYRFGDLKLK